MTPREAKIVLEGVLQLACRKLGRAPQNFALKTGGTRKSGKERISWYLSVQNVDGPNVGSKRAREERLIRRVFAITQVTDSDPVYLSEEVWTYEFAGSEYRETWVVVDSNGTRMQLADRVGKAIQELRPK